MNNEQDDGYENAYGLYKDAEEILQDINEQAIKAAPYTPPWYLRGSKDYQEVYIRTLYAFDTGEIVWIKDPAKRKSHLNPTNKKDTWSLFSCGTVAFIIWTVWTLYSSGFNETPSTGFALLIKLAWLFVAWIMPIALVRR